ncbi:hypothetical protein NC652_004185 [Populus alba x Populus x berolinensis]|nr:hypothetical protein NC652_004185 [Populus alba x Populus x berolinensis]
MADSQSPNLAFEKESIIIVQHGIFALLLKTSNNYIQVKYQSVQASPWDTHNLIMFIFLLALFIYATALVVEVMLRASESIHHTHVGNIRLFAGGFAAILLLAILYPILGCIISLMWVCLFVKIAFESFQELYSVLCQTVVGVLHMSSKLIGSVRCLEEEETNQPPAEEMADSNNPNLAFESIVIVQHGIFALLLKTSNNYIQVKYQSVQASPWDTHHLIMFIFLLALFIYATALVVEVMLRASESIHHTHVGNIRLFAGGFAAILLLAILYPILGCIISLMWVCLFVKIAFESFQELYSILCQTVVGVLHMSSRLIGSVRCLEEEEPDQPPA